MTPHYLLDTDWVIHYLNGRQDLVDRVEALRDAGLGLSVISLAQLYEGVYYSRIPDANERALNGFLRGVVILGIDEETCKAFGKERGRLRAAGERSAILIS
jgi:tRNA(fMet)-specific endonuclease VapC